MSALTVRITYQAVRQLPAAGNVDLAFGLTTVTTQPFVVRGFNLEPAQIEADGGQFGQNSTNTLDGGTF